MSNKLQEITQDFQTRVRELAYLMWESAGRQQGMAMEYWLKAEREVLSTLQEAATRMVPSTPRATADDESTQRLTAEAQPAVAEAAFDASPQSEPGAKASARKNTTRSKSKT